MRWKDQFLDESSWNRPKYPISLSRWWKSRRGEEK
jgi:hypothetical protein